MMRPRTHWSIVVADDHGPDWAPSPESSETHLPVQYCRLGDRRTLLQKALHRGTHLASPWRTLVTAREQYRQLWEPALWYVKPGQRFVCGHRWSSWLTTAAALLRIVNESPSSVVAVLPARCFVANEDILAAAMERALEALPSVSEGVVTLGMIDRDLAVDEDYLVPSSEARGPFMRLLGVARRPADWVAQHLRNQGAMVASGIMIGYADVFAAHISRYWPGISARLLRLVGTACAAGTEAVVPNSLQRGVPRSMLRTLRWYPPSLPQRALRVPHCGWSGLRSAQAVARVTASAFTSADALARLRSRGSAVAAP